MPAVACIFRLVTFLSLISVLSCHEFSALGVGILAEPKIVGMANAKSMSEAREEEMLEELLQLIAQQRSDVVITNSSVSALDDFGRRLMQRLRALGGIEVSAIFDMSDDLLVDRFNSLLGPLTVEEARAPRENNPKLLAPQAWLIQLQSGKQLPQIQLLSRLARDFPTANVSFIILGNPAVADELLQSRVGQFMLHWPLPETSEPAAPGQTSSQDTPATDQAATERAMQAFRLAQQARDAQGQLVPPKAAPKPAPLAAKSRLPRDGMRLSFLVAAIALLLLGVSVGFELLVRPESSAKFVVKPKAGAPAPSSAPTSPAVSPPPSPTPSPAVAPTVDPATAAVATDRSQRDSAAFRAAVEKRFDDWKTLWSARKADEFLALFDPAFPDLQAYSNNRKARMQAAKFIELKVEQVEFIATEPERLTIRFIQSYQSDTFQTKGLKELVWINTPKGPRIIAERALGEQR